jgi:hypothetical protein
MIEQTGLTYAASEYLKMLVASVAKDGKTSFLVAGALGALPWQQYGGLVSEPKNLHVLTFDATALGGIRPLLTKSCGKGEEYCGLSVYNFERDIREIHSNKGEWDYALFNGIIATIDRIKQKIAKGGVHAVVVSSVTGVAKGIQRGIAGEPSAAKKGSGMDASKWQTLESELTQIQNAVQALDAHVFWEAHVDRAPEFGQSKSLEAPRETLMIKGGAGRWWAFNTEQVVRMRREYGNKVGSLDKVHMETRPSADFLSSGRGFNEKLNPKEYDMTEVALKLGLKVGRFGAPKK